MTVEEKLAYLENFVSNTSSKRLKELEDKENENTQLKAKIIELQKQNTELKVSIDQKNKSMEGIIW